MEEKDEENGAKSQTQSLLHSRSRLQTEGEESIEAGGEVSVKAESEVSVEAKGNSELEPSSEPSVTYASSHPSQVVTIPSALKSKSTSEKSRSNISSPAKVSIKTSGEREQDTETVSDSLLKESSMVDGQITVARSTTTDSNIAGVVKNGIGSKGSSRGRVVNSSGNRGTVVTSAGGGVVGASRGGGNLPSPAGLLQQRSPFIHDPPYPEERRSRVQPPRSPIDYIINLREDLADFQESHGLPRTRDYSFVSLGLALAQETGRAILSVFQMFTELFPILAIVSLIFRFALDKLIEILETTEPVAKIKKSVVFALEMLAIMIPLWILFGTIIIPLITLILSLFKRVLRIRGVVRPLGEPLRMPSATKNGETFATGKKAPPPPKPKPKPVNPACAFR